jgi:hypothetical protein
MSLAPQSVFSQASSLVQLCFIEVSPCYRYPAHMTLLRGNHESRQITQVCLSVFEETYSLGFVSNCLFPQDRRKSCKKKLGSNPKSDVLVQNVFSSVLYIVACFNSC